MNLRNHHVSAFFIFAVLFFFLTCGSATATETGDSDYRCHSAFKENPKAKDSTNPPSLVMAVFGDSIMWGQGLRERDKFWCRAKQWLELKTGREVEPYMYAHAGAVIDEKSLLTQESGKDHYELVLKVGEIGEEVNVSFPTINEQVQIAADKLKGKKVDFVLVDGCINDLNFRTLMNAGNTKTGIDRATTDFCGKPMLDLLRHINKNFPCAFIIVTGYYPLVYKGLPVEKDGKVEFKKGTAKNQLTRLLLRQLGKNVSVSKKTFENLDELSRTWHEASNKILKSAVDDANRDFGEHKKLVHFAELHFPPEYGFSTKQSMLWNFRFGATNVGGLRKIVALALDAFRVLETNDDSWDLRRKQCSTAEKKFNKAFKQLADDERKDKVEKQLQWFESICQRGSLAHPNRFGAALYAQSIISKLDAFLPHTGWMPAETHR